jgi:hypothetical protein
VTAEIDAAHDQRAREHKRLASEAAMPVPPDPSRAWEDLRAEDRRALRSCWSTRSSSLRILAPSPRSSLRGGGD